MTDRTPHGRFSALEAAERQLRAAETLLFDPACKGTAEASLHVARALRALAKAHGARDTSAGEVPKVEEVDLPALGAAERREWRRLVAKMSRLDALEPWEEPQQGWPSREQLAFVCDVLSRVLPRVRKHLAVPKLASTARFYRGWLGLSVAIGGILALWTYVSGTALPWRGAYFSNTELLGRAIVSDTESLAFEWYDRAPLPGLPADGFSAVFVSCLQLDETTPVRFSLGSDDGSRLYVDGKLLIDNWGQHQYRTLPAAVELAPGRHLLRVEYFDISGRARVGLWAAFGGGLLELIPPDRLIRPRDGGDPCA